MPVEFLTAEDLEPIRRLLEQAAKLSANNTTQISENSDTITRLEQTQAANAGAITRLEQTQAANADAITRLEQTQAANADAITRLTARMEELAAAQTVNADAIARLEQTQTANADAITRLTARTEELVTAQTAAAQRIDELAFQVNRWMGSTGERLSRLDAMIERYDGVLAYIMRKEQERENRGEA